MISSALSGTGGLMHFPAGQLKSSQLNANIHRQWRGREFIINKMPDDLTLASPGLINLQMHRLGAIVLGDVSQNGGEQVLSALAKRAQRHLQQNLSAAEVASGKLHRHSLFARIQMPPNFRQMRLIKVIWQQQGQVLPEQLLRRRSKSLFGDRIDENDFTGLVNDDNGIGGGFSENPVALLAIAKHIPFLPASCH